MMSSQDPFGLSIVEEGNCVHGCNMCLPYLGRHKIFSFLLNFIYISSTFPAQDGGSDVYVVSDQIG